MNRRENTLRVYRRQACDFFPRSWDFANIFFPMERASDPVAGKDGFGVSWVVIPNAGQTIQYPDGFPLTDITQWRDQVRWPDHEHFDFAADAAKQTANWNRETQVGTMTMFNGPFERLCALMGFENAVLSFYDEPEAVHEFLTAHTEYKLRCIRLSRQYYNPDVIIYHDDWGTNSNLFFSPDLWREFLKPHIQAVIDETHRLGMFFEMHSCGHIEETVGELVELGIDSIQTLQHPQNNIRMIKQNWGGKLVIRGGYDGQLIIQHDSTEQDIRRSTRECLEILAPGGNHIPYFYAFGEGIQQPLAFFNDEISQFEAIFFQ